MRHFKSAIWPLLVAVVATAAMVPVRRFVFVQIFEIEAPFLPFLLAVVAAAWIAGLWSGLFATALTSATVVLFFYERPGFEGYPEAFPVRLAFFVVVGGLVSWLMASLQSARQRMAERQTELEQEMKRRAEAETALHEREERMRMAVDSADIGTWDFSPVTGERNWSERTKVMFGLQPDADVTNVSFLERIHPEDQGRASQAVQQALDPGGDGRYEIECRLLLPDERVGWFIVKGRAFFDCEGQARRPNRFIGTVMEITERKKAEQALREAEERFRKLAIQAPVGIFHTDADGRCLLVNDAWCAIVGATAEQAMGDGWAKFLHPEDQMRVVEQWQEDARNRHNHAMECRFLNPVAGTRHVAASAIAMLDDAGKVAGYVGTVVDLTDRKAAEELLRRTIKEQDEERQLIAYQIHDGLIQDLTGAILQLDAIRLDDAFMPAGESLETLADILRRAAAEGRRIMNGIRTPVLDELGVVYAIEQLIEEEGRAHVQVEFVKDENIGRMDPKIEEAIYRITQEALTNVGKHSQAKRVRVELARHDDQVHLEVRDWGVGFAVSTISKETYGVRGMCERARIAGGLCRVESTPGEGTCVVVDLPYRPRCDGQVRSETVIGGFNA